MESRQTVKTKTAAKPILQKKSVNNNKIKDKKTNVKSAQKLDQIKIKKITNNDLISRIISKNLHHILKQIFLTLSPGELSVCRLVSASWREYLTDVFWVDKGIRSVLEDKLEKNWRFEKHKRVEVQVEGATCRENCGLNYRPCDCPLLCQVAQNALVILFGSKDYKGTYIINDCPATEAQHDFGRPQYQVRLSLKLDLLLDTSNFLWKPVFHKKQVKKTKLLHCETIIEIDQNEKTFLILKNKASKEILRRIQPYTGWGDCKPIAAMVKSSGRLALLISGRVFVYSLVKLIEGCSEDECLLLVGTRQNQPPVDFLHLEPNYLLTAGGGTVVLFSFWSDECSPVSEFFT
eukprot:GFUD01029959.1.p1 GENE.GFUD01029959.1~~GFUD01029959.1.p1  ORF type:complete len:348 (-),score=59.07 GFUD01029959.1:64-1107(-)